MSCRKDPAPASADSGADTKCNNTSGECPNKPKPKLVQLTVIQNATLIQNATQSNVTGAKNWATVKKSTDDVIIEATTTPNNNEEEWKQITWSGDSGAAVPGKPNQRKLSRATSKKYHVEAELGGVKDHVDVWVLAATIEIRSAGSVPKNAAPFQSLFGTTSQNLGPTTEESLVGTVYPGDKYVLNMSARGKIVAIATLTPSGVHDVVKDGWSFHRERLTQHWLDRKPGDQSTATWTNDTSKPDFVRLTPDISDKIYDTDGPDIRWGARSYEIYHNFRQWVEWQSQRCSDYAYWHFRALWQAHPNQNQQIRINDVGPGQRELPTSPAGR